MHGQNHIKFLATVNFIILITSLNIIYLLHLHLKRVPNAY